MRIYRTPGVYFEQQDAAAPSLGLSRTDIAGFVGIAERGPLHTPVKIESRAQFSNVFGRKLAQAYLAYAIDSYFANGGQSCWIVRVADSASAQVASLDLIDATGGRLLGLKAGSPGSWGNRIQATWIVRGDTLVSLTLHYDDGTELLIRNPVEMTADVSALNYERDSLPSTLLAPRVSLEASSSGTPSKNKVSIFEGQGVFAGGTDGLKSLTVDHFTGDNAPSGEVWGLAALEAVREVSVVAMPDIMPKLMVEAQFQAPPPYDCRKLNASVTVTPIPQTPPEFAPNFDSSQIYELQVALIRHCEKARYRVAVLDTPDLLVPEAAMGIRRQFTDTSYAALYYPWILVDDPLLLTGIVRAVPPSGAVAGVYARNDLQHGVHKPPANAVIEDARDVRFEIDQVVHGELNDASVNAIRSYPQRGVCVFGARTVSGDTLWRYVNVRRLIAAIEKSIDLGSQWMAFEPNDIRLRREIDRIVRTFLESLFRQGMLDGTDSDSAYSVKCDDTNNPSEVTDLGRVVCEVGVQPPYPAEFVVIVIGKTQNAIEILQESGAVHA